MKKYIFSLLITLVWNLFPSTVIAANGLTITEISAGTQGQNGWHTTPPRYHKTFKCGLGLQSEWSPDEGIHSYDWGQQIDSTSGRAYLRIDNQEWKQNMGGQCTGSDSDISIVKSIPLIKVDRSLPVVNTSKPYEGESFDTNTVKIEGNVTDSVSGIQTVTLDGLNLIIGNDGSFSKILEKNPGVHTVTIVAKDFAGNESRITKTFKVLNITHSSPINNSSSQNTTIPPTLNNQSTKNASVDNQASKNISTPTTSGIINSPDLNNNLLPTSSIETSPSPTTNLASPLANQIENSTEILGFHKNVFPIFILIILISSLIIGGIIKRRKISLLRN